MKKRTCTVEVVEGRLWAYLTPCRDPTTAPVHELLLWIVEQLSLGNSRWTIDPKGRAINLVVGSAAAPAGETTALEEVSADVRSRLLAVNIAGLFAQAREEGVEPEHSRLVEKLRDTATEAAHDNTQVHYALELLRILARIGDVSFVFSAPPIKTRAGPSVVALLREATRAYLFNLRRSCVSLCRALLEAALREKVSEAELLKERFETKKGELECLVNITGRRGLLSVQHRAQSHGVRKAGNTALHGSEPSNQEAWHVLQDTRVIVSALYS